MTPSQMDRTSRIDSRILTLESGLDYQVNEAISVGIGYRYQDYHDETDFSPLDFEGQVHTFTLSATVQLGYQK